MIEVVGLAAEKSGRRTLEDIDLRIAPGSRVALLGPSGSGKTSLLRLLAGFDRPCRGEIRISGRTVSSPTGCTHPSGRRMSMVFQHLALWPHLTVRQHLEFVRGNAGGGQPCRCGGVEELLGRVRLSAFGDRRPESLSGGERQRLAIARALASAPEHLLLDEPFSSLDDLLKGEMLALTRTLSAERNVTVVYVTHQVEEALSLAETIVVLNGGRIVRTWGREAVGALTRDEVLQACFGGGPP